MLRKIAIQFILLMVVTQSYGSTLLFDDPNLSDNHRGFIWDNVRKKT